MALGRIFDQWAVLDPQRERQQAEAGVGGLVLDQWAVLDPARFRSKVEEALNSTTVFTPIALLDTFVSELEIEGAGGSPAVAFDGNTKLVCPALEGTDNGKLTMSVWFKYSASGGGSAFVQKPFQFSNISINIGARSGDIPDGTFGLRAGGVLNDSTPQPTGNWNGIALSLDASKMYTQLFGGDVYSSANTGVTWTDRTAAGARFWVIGGCSDDGATVYMCEQWGFIYKSTDSGATWARLTGAGLPLGGLAAWNQVACSSNGASVVAIVGSVAQGYIYVSHDGGDTWSAATAPGKQTWAIGTISGDGTKIAVFSTPFSYSGAPSDDGLVHVSTDGGTTWTTATLTAANDINSPTNAVKYSRDGSHLYAAVGNTSGIWVSTDDGATWTQRPFTIPAGAIYVSCSTDGSTVIAAGGGASYSYISTDFGATWTRQDTLGAIGWVGVGASGDGSVMAATQFGGNLFTYASGTWTQQNGLTSNQNLSGASYLFGNYNTNMWPPASDDEWHNLIFSGDAGTGKVCAYLDDEPIDQATYLLPSSPPPTSLFNTDLDFWVGGFGTTFLGSLADFFIYAGLSLLDGSGDIPVAARRNFITAALKPVDPAVTVGALGEATVQLSGGADTFGTNQGSGGEFLVASGALTDAAGP
jgi:photosystem II stability/assembly factor-like uncharacterized protein